MRQGRPPFYSGEERGVRAGTGEWEGTGERASLPGDPWLSPLLGEKGGVGLTQA